MDGDLGRDDWPGYLIGGRNVLCRYNGMDRIYSMCI